jgi:hypothetical protein
MEAHLLLRLLLKMSYLLLLQKLCQSVVRGLGLQRLMEGMHVAYERS